MIRFLVPTLVPILVLLLAGGCAVKNSPPSTSSIPPAAPPSDAASLDAPPATALPVFHVDPGLHDARPRLVAEVDPAGPALLFRTLALDPDSPPENRGRVLDMQVFRGKSRIEYRPPAVARDTYATIDATPEHATPRSSDEAPPETEDKTDADADGARAPTPTPEPLFSWNVLLRPDGARLLDYAGRPGAMTPPDDFDAYWARAVAELDAIALEPVVARVPEKDTATGMLFRVVLPAVRETTIVCWYFVPRSVFDTEGRVVARCPAVIVMPGYGAEQPPMDRTAQGLATLSINPRNHGPSKDFWTAPVEHLVHNLEDPENYYYRLAFLDCLQGARFALSRPEIDVERVAAEGGSQGGLFALAVAALEPRIACVCTNVTAFSAYPDGMALARIGHHATFRRRLAEATPEQAERIRLSLRYTDGANLAGRVRCPVQIVMGGLDPVCPYPCGATIYNRLPEGVERELRIVPEARHEVPDAMREHNRDWYRRWLGVEDPPTNTVE